MRFSIRFLSRFLSMEPYGISQTYVSPDWAKGLTVVPKTRIKLAQLPTPIHKWTVPDIPDEFQLYIKRDDLTGAALSGNKIRKLEFIFGEALEQGCDTVITGGNVQSNHARATAMVAKELGINSHLVLYLSDGQDYSSIKDTNSLKGNMLLNRLTGSVVDVIPFLHPDLRMKTANQSYVETSEKLTAQGGIPYVLKLGGVGVAGCWGYIEAFNEMTKQGLLDHFDDMIVCIATGGTACGLGVANYLTGSRLKIHAFCLKMPQQTIVSEINEELVKLGAVTREGDRPLTCADIFDIIDVHSYAQPNLDLLTSLSTQTGIILDTTFTLKTVQYMMEEMNTNPGRFKGRRVLYVHTGGLFGLHDNHLSPLLTTTPSTNRVHSIQDFITI